MTASADLESREGLVASVAEVYGCQPWAANRSTVAIASFRGIERDFSLCQIANDLGVALSPPRSKAVVVVIGDAASGKSTFINWYIKEAVQQTGPPVETREFALITRGWSRVDLFTSFSRDLFPWLSSTADLVAAADCVLTTRTFAPVEDGLGPRGSFVDFVDTPGTDARPQDEGELLAVYEALAEVADLVIVLLDPAGPVLSPSLGKVVSRLYEMHPRRIRFCLSKMDEVTSEPQRVKLVCKATQALSAVLPSGADFELDTIGLPGARDGTYLLNAENDEEGEVPALAVSIERCVNLRVQSSIAQMRKDAANLESVIERHEHARRMAAARNAGIRRVRLCLLLAATILFCLSAVLSIAFRVRDGWMILYDDNVPMDSSAANWTLGMLSAVGEETEALGVPARAAGVPALLALGALLLRNCVRPYPTSANLEKMTAAQLAFLKAIPEYFAQLQATYIGST